jgi:hypothetical protein
MAPAVDVGGTPASARLTQHAGRIGRRADAPIPDQEVDSSSDAGRAMEHAHADDVVSEAISIARCRELLGEEADDLSDQEIKLLRHHATTMAHVIVDMFLETGATPE